MTDLTGQRIQIQQEEVAADASVNENTFSRMGQAVNFVNTQQFNVHNFHYNGLYRLFNGIVGADGVFHCDQNIQLTRLDIFQRKGGSTSSTIFDIIWYSSNGTNEGSIFSTKPEFSFNVPDFGYYQRDLINDNTIAAPVGATDPVLNRTTFPEGSILICVLDQSMPDAEDISLTLKYRPINASEVE